MGHYRQKRSQFSTLYHTSHWKNVSRVEQHFFAGKGITKAQFRNRWKHFCWTWCVFSVLMLTKCRNRWSESEHVQVQSSSMRCKMKPKTRLRVAQDLFEILTLVEYQCKRLKSQHLFLLGRSETSSPDHQTVHNHLHTKTRVWLLDIKNI